MKGNEPPYRLNTFFQRYIYKMQIAELAVGGVAAVVSMTKSECYFNRDYRGWGVLVGVGADQLMTSSLPICPINHY